MSKAKARSANWINNVQRLQIGQCLGFCKSSLIFSGFWVCQTCISFACQTLSVNGKGRYTFKPYHVEGRFAICPEAHSWKRNLVIVLAETQQPAFSRSWDRIRSWEFAS